MSQITKSSLIAALSYVQRPEGQRRAAAGLSTAINDTDTRVTTLEGQNLNTRVTALEALKSPPRFVGITAAPTGTVSATMVMMGLGATWTMTPQVSGVILVTLCGRMNNNAALAARGTIITLMAGTGAAPANGAAASGSIISADMTAANVTTTSELFPFSISGFFSGAAVGTAAWFDVKVAATGGSGTAAVINVTGVAFELY